MNAERTLIVAVGVLAIGLGLIFGFCHGNAGVSAAYPPSGASFQLSITTTGFPAEGGFAATVIGVVLLLAAFLQASWSRFDGPTRTQNIRAAPLLRLSGSFGRGLMRDDLVFDLVISGLRHHFFRHQIALGVIRPVINDLL